MRREHAGSSHLINTLARRGLTRSTRPRAICQTSGAQSEAGARGQAEAGARTGECAMREEAGACAPGALALRPPSGARGLALHGRSAAQRGRLNRACASLEALQVATYEAVYQLDTRPDPKPQADAVST